MEPLEHLRHKPLASLDRPRELIVACAPMRSHVNLSQIARVAGCCAAARLICCGAARIVGRIARDAAETLPVEVHRTLGPPLARLKSAGHVLIGLEQTNRSRSLFEFQFPRAAVLVVGNERLGLEPDVLRLVDEAVEIPVYGLPHSYNVAMATAMALYEYCRQYPRG